VLLLHHSVGDFVPTGARMAEVLGGEPFPRALHLRRMFVLSQERTIEQDPAFALRILVDIAIRALSPAVNDPTTAVQVLDYIEDLLLAIGRRRVPGCGEFHDAGGRLRVLVPARAEASGPPAGVPGPVAVQQRGEHAGGVETRGAEPVHGPLAAHQRSRLQVTDQPVVSDRRVAVHVAPLLTTLGEKQ
jgi:hypothetical protein